MSDYNTYQFKGYKGLPTKIIYDTTKGAKRKPPFKYILYIYFCLINITIF